MADQLVENDQLVDHLRGALRDGRSGLEYVPKLLRRVLEQRAWERRVDRVTGAEVGFATFAEFVTTPPSEGLGTDVELVRRIVSDDQEARTRLTEALRGRQGRRSDLDNNIQEVPAPQGTSSERALRKLRKDRPDLHAQVLDGVLSPHAAMVEAGFRPRTITVRTDRPDSIARTLRKALTDDQLAELVRLLGDS